MATRRRRRRRRHNPFIANPRKRHRRRGFRRNPLSLGGRGGIMGKVMDGLKGGVGVVLGKAAARAVPTFIGQDRTKPIGIALQALAGIILAPIVGRFGGGEIGRAFLWGAFAAPIEGFVVGANIPMLSPALSSYPEELSALPYVPGALSAGPGAGMPGFTIDEEEASLVQ